LARAAETSPSESAVAAPFGRRPLRTFALVIALPALLLYVVSVALVVFALAGMAREINRLENTRSVTSMHAALDSFLNDLGGTVADQGTWDEAYLNVVVKPDPGWMDTAWGAAARLGQSYDTVLVTDQAGAILFGEDAAGTIKGNIVQRYPAAHTMLADLDKGIGSTTDATTISRFAADTRGTVGLAAISIHRAAPGQLSVPRLSRRILWIGRHLTPGLLQDIAVRYQTPLAILTPEVEQDASSITLGNADGDVVGTLSWIPDRPGDTAFNHAILLASVIFVGIGVVLVTGLGALRRAMLRRVRPAGAAARVDAGNGAEVARRQEPESEAGGAAESAADPASAIAGVNPGDFTIEYQPVLDLRAEALTGVDAMLRWANPDRSPLAAEDIAPADCARLLDRIGMIALRRAADEIAPLIGLTLTFPVTPGQLANSVFIEKVAGTLGATNLPARRLQLRVDASLLPPPGDLAGPLGELRQRGVLLALGGFALDSRTAAILDAKLFDRVCLAGALAAQVGGSAGDMYLRASIEAARGAGLAITATGVERREAAAAVLRLGCRDVQGNLLARPVSISALTQLVLAPARPGVRKVG
jgi:EAL domain-containing protein (putative c-di-GMP-specific phosphodiesterase class I)